MTTEERSFMEASPITIHRPVMGQDLNHHGTLYAARTAEWFVEAGFIAAASLSRPENIVCIKVHNMEFLKPVKKGAILKLESKVVLTGRTSLVVYVQGNVEAVVTVKGFLSFVHVDDEGRPQPHGATITPSSKIDLALQQEALALRK
jgi:acyl-CoA hydrolase